MTKSEKRKIIYAACELIEQGIHSDFLIALNSLNAADSLGWEVFHFYGPFFESVDFLLFNKETEVKSLRILLLLNFLEATT